MQLIDRYEHDRKVWDACARAYESAIVLGHPDVTAYERFEEDFLDRLLLFLARDTGQEVHLYDVGCGSGRLHLRYGLQTLDPASCAGDSPGRQLQGMDPGFRYSPEMARGLKRVGGLDFSSEMLELARRKLESAGLQAGAGARLYLEQGSAFELPPLPAAPVPLAVTLCNSIGVMQGPEGARAVFQSMRRAVADAGGIAVISAYRRDAVRNFALGNYESTMDVSGQPVWLTPDTYAAPGFTQKPRAYTRAYDARGEILVDVRGADGELVKQGHMLRRDPEAVAQTIVSGHIRTHHGYESRWYDTDQFRAWIRQWWPADRSWHIAGRALDALRAAPVQLAILDAGGRLEPFFERMGMAERSGVF